MIPLLFAVSEGHVDLVDCLIKNRADVNIGDASGFKPIDYALWNKDWDVVKLLLGKGVDVNAKAKLIGNAALHIAAADGNREVVEFLISKDADVNAQNGAGKAPLHIAVERGHLDVVQILLNSGAEVAAKDKNGKTPLDLSQEAEKSEIVELLKKHEAKE